MIISTIQLVPVDGAELKKVIRHAIEISETLSTTHGLTDVVFVFNGVELRVNCTSSLHDILKIYDAKVVK